MNILGMHFHNWSKWEHVTLVSSIPILEAFGHSTQSIVQGQKRACKECNIEVLRQVR